MSVHTLQRDRPEMEGRNPGILQETLVSMFQDPAKDDLQFIDVRQCCGTGSTVRPWLVCF